MSNHRRAKRQRRKHFHRQSGVGAAPGSVIVDPQAPRPTITIMAYGPDKLSEHPLTKVEEIKSYLNQWPVVWINVDGLGDAGVLQQLGDLFHLHRLALEDVVNVHQRAKVDQFQEQLFIVARMVTAVPHLESEQVSMFVGKNFVLTFQEGGPGDSFEPVRQRIRDGRGKIRETGADYLMYSLLDAIIDAYFPVLELYGERVDELEDAVLLLRQRDTLNRIHTVKTDLLTLRRAIWPLREAVNALQRDPTPLIEQDTRLYLRDCYDHTVQLIDLLEMYRELGSDLRDLYLSSISNRMNEIMKVLTIISTIFIPLNFIAGVYGMNFHHENSPWNMPETTWYYGYPFALSLMALLSIGMLFFFRRKGWIGRAATLIEHPNATDPDGPPAV